MKRRWEWPWFVIPFVLLPVCSVLGTFFNFQQGVPQFMDAENYLRLLWNDRIFWRAASNTLLACWMSGGVLALALGLAVRLLQRWVPMSRPVRYMVIFSAATVITAVVWLAGVRLVPTVYNMLFFLQLGNAAAFFVWLAELIWTAVKKPKQEVETR